MGGCAAKPGALTGASHWPDINILMPPPWGNLLPGTLEKPWDAEPGSQGDLNRCGWIEF
jgi:hypothetical protein